MESFGNELRVQQGESFNLDIRLSASSREYIPYIISSERKNPFFVITVASTKYEKNLRYIKSWWCDVNDSKNPIPTFYSTVPVNYNNGITPVETLNDIGSLTLDAIQSNFNDTDFTWDEGPDYETKELKRYLYYADNIEDANGNIIDRVYFYLDYTLIDWDHQNCTTKVVIDYECHIRMNFLTKDTAEWTSQNYLYQITLVSGQTMENYLNSIKIDKQIPNDIWPQIEDGMTEIEKEATIKAQYKFVKANYPNLLQPDIDADSPLGFIDMPEVILQPTKLEVFNNLRKLI